ncbi:MAG TPA: ankyrin repeat domain-containing protein, partial [Burkholderiaceae bacterium]|nr:ankyrin repeat domain-containing protein [Burkholderiaceae bacterium]
GSVKEFERSGKGMELKRQFRVGIEQLKSFLRDNNAPRAEAAAGALTTFRNRVLEGTEGRYDLLIGGIYNQGKASLDALCVDVKNREIPLPTRISVVQNLAEGVDVCVEGVLSNLVMASQELRLSTVGLKGHAKKVWKNILDQVLLQFCNEKHGDSSTYEEYEIHYVNGYRNFVAQEFGVEPQEDRFVSAIEISHLMEALEVVRKEVTAESLVRVLSENCLNEVLDHFKDYAGRALSEDEAWKCYQKYESLQAALESRYGPIGMHLLVNDSEGNGTEDRPYTLISDPTLLMRAIARNLKKVGLIEKEKFQVMGRETKDRGTATQSEVMIKRIFNDAVYVKEKAKDGTKVYRTPQLSELLMLSSPPLNLLRRALIATPDRNVLRRVPAKLVWRMIRYGQSMNWLDNFRHPAVRRYRQASSRNNAALEREVMEWIGSHDRETRLATLEQLVRIGEVALANKAATYLGSGQDDFVPVGGEPIPDQLTILHEAVQSGDCELAEILIGVGEIDVNERTYLEGLTALMMAADREDEDMINLLVGKSDLAIRDHRCQTVLMRAVRNGNNVSVAALLNNGADPNYETPEREPRERWRSHNQENTALAVAAARGNEAAARLLVTAGADVNKKSFGFSPIGFAAEAGHANVVRILLDNHARQEHPGNDDEEDALLIALNHGRVEAAKVLMKGASRKSLGKAIALLSRDRIENRELIREMDDLLSSEPCTHRRHRRTSSSVGTSRRGRFTLC